MIYLQDFIDVLEQSLSGGAITADTRTKYDPQFLRAVVGTVFSEVVMNNQGLKKQMAIPFELTPDMTDPKYKAAMPVEPFSGNNGIVWVTDSKNTFYVVRNGAVDSLAMGILKPAPASPTLYYQDGYLYFLSKPSESVTAYILPNVHDMEDDFPLILEENERMFLDLCFMQVQKIMAKPVDLMNNQKIDNE